MVIVLNGKEREVSDGITVTDLVASLGYSNRQVVVEYNRDALDRTLYNATVLREGDVIEIVRAVAGG